MKTKESLTLMNFIILTLNSDVVENIKKLLSDKESPIIDIESTMSLIFYYLQITTNFEQALRCLIDEYKNDYLMSGPGTEFADISNQLNTFRKLVISLHTNLAHYGLIINDQSPYDFGSFINNEEIVLRKAKDSINKL